MLSRVKQALVESYIGAIGLGYLLAEIIMNFVGIFTSPVASWITRREFGVLARQWGTFGRSPLQEALPELIRFVLLLVLWYVLLRWLYFTPVKQEPSERIPDSESPA